tara:strand:- start:230 stop:487 length:258 start_codon:yes stop_codon:yes gene_type:complete
MESKTKKTPKGVPPHKKNVRRSPSATRETHITTMRIDAELWAEAQRLAEVQHTSATSVIEQCLAAGLPRLEKLYSDFQKNEAQGE